MQELSDLQIFYEVPPMNIFSTSIRQLKQAVAPSGTAKDSYLFPFALANGSAILKSLWL